MLAAMEERVVWHPVTAEQKTAVRTALADVLADPHFCNSKRYPAFLAYVVDAVLTGHEDELKERALGIEVFGRRPDYDTNSDTIVRYTAGEVRKRLALYYSEAHPAPAIRIHLPIGAYVPKLLLRVHPEADEPVASTRLEDLPPRSKDDVLLQEAMSLLETAELRPLLPTQNAAASVSHGPLLVDARTADQRTRRIGLWLLAASLLVIAFISTFALRHLFGSSRGDAVLTPFWAPTLNASGTTLICSGSVVFAPNSFSGVTTAPKGTDYSFLSVQIAESIAHVSGYLERHGATYKVQTSASTSLTDLRERPVILLGGYNNTWSMRLLEPLRFHFSPNLASPAIVDARQPTRTWARDQTQSYGSADDYAIVARFTDSMSDSPVVVLAGLGRNGTEAATQFVTSPEFLAEYTQHALSSKGNVEFVLRSRVVEGKTGAPSVIGVYEW